MTFRVRPVHGAGTIEAFTRATRRLVESALQLNTAEVVRRGWAAAPVESGAHFTTDDAQQIARAIRSRGVTDCIGLVTESLAGVDPCVQIDATADGLLEFNSVYGHFNCVLGPDDRMSWLLLCTVEDYYLIAGPRAFVSEALGTSLEVARAAFARFSDELGRGSLRAVSERYRYLDGSATAGS